jgi:hypothetical protein
MGGKTYPEDPRKVIAELPYQAYMSDYRTTLALVRQANTTARQPGFASWF